MRGPWAWTFLLLLLLPWATAEPEGPDTRCTAPCGWINPIIDLHFPDKPLCGGDLVLGTGGTASDCLAPPTRDKPLVLEGTVRWYWDVTSEATYPNDPTQDIVITFTGNIANPQWISFRVEPESYTLTTVDLFSPENFQVQENSGTDAQVFFWFERPITVTFERTGEPTGEDLQRLRDRDGIQSVFLKARSTASGDRFREGFGIEEFKFRAGSDPELAGSLSQPAPAVGPVFPAAAVALALVLRRIRRR